MLEIETALCLIDIIRLAKSWTPPKNIEPNIIHINAGTQPHKATAIIGPTMGPAPAILEK